MFDSEDRRRSPRLVSRFPLRYQLLPFDGSGYLEASAEDLSQEGVRFSCTTGFRARAGMLFELLVPGEQPVRSFGRAAWVRQLPEQDGFEVGGWFEDQSTVARRSIARLLEHQTFPSHP